MSSGRRWLGAAIAVLLVTAGLTPVTGARSAEAAVLPAGFQEQVVFTGLVSPTNIEFAADGRVFVTEKRGTVKVFDSLADPTPTVFADLSTQVHDQWDRGLLGLALAPNFPADPWVYVLYTYDALPGGTAPRWNDVCPDANNGNCVVTGRLSRLRAEGNQMTGAEQVLITDWCQQFPSHSIGDLHFGADGALYASSGDGASFSAVDYGQLGSPRNPCADPPGGTMAPPGAEGGALRSQDVRTTGDPTQLHGTIIRVDPATGAALPDNPMFGSADSNARRIVAQGMRNPFRFTIRPGTNEVFSGDVGWNTYEEINRVANPTGGVSNHGWPCFEGVPRQAGYDSPNLTLCESLYSAGGQVAPYFQWNHNSRVVTGESCPSGSSSASGVAFYPGSGPYPATYRGALFFSDYSRDCIWAMMPGTNGLPNPSNVITFAAGAANPVDLAIGPGNELYYVDLGGSVRRVRYFAGNQPPIGAIAATPTSGGAPLVVSFDGTGSTDPDPADAGLLTYQWDFTNNGSFDATGPTASFTYAAAGTYTARLRVTDTLGATNDRTVTITAGNDAPTAAIDTPLATLAWAVGDTISFGGHASDPQQGTLPPSALRWQIVLNHCSSPGVCHEHVLQTLNGVASGAFTAPDHEYPSTLQLRLTATDAGGLTSTTSVLIEPRTVELTFATQPAGLQLAVGSTTQVTPFARTVIVGSTNSLGAPTPQSGGALPHVFSSWSDGGAQTHTIVAPAANASYTATFVESCGDSFGYTCSTSAQPFIGAEETVIPLTGDDAIRQITLPFPFPFYGQSHTTAWLDTNGKLSFTNPGTYQADNTAIPAAAQPNNTIYALWDDLVVDAQASIRSALLGTAPNRQFVIEWRNPYQYGFASRRVNAEIVLHENGNVVTNYSGIDNPAEAGAFATVGIENASGTVGIQSVHNAPVLANGTALLFRPPGGAPPPPPGTGTIAGTISTGGSPVAGAVVTLTPLGRTTTSAVDGQYTFADVPPGSYTVAATSGTSSLCGGGSAASAPATVASGASTTVNLALTAGTSDPFGYTCTDRARSFVDAGTVLPLTGDDTMTQVTLPFPVTLYGQSYPTAWVDTNGKVSFVNPGGSDAENTTLPSSAAPNATVYPFWEDLVVDGAASVRTAVIGSAPNRGFVVEWRNVFIYGNTSRRLTAEVVFYENGEIAFAYKDLDNTAERGSGATVGIENASGTIALQYSVNQPVLVSGNGVLFRPPS